MLYRVSLGQEALYKFLQGFGVFLHSPFHGSIAHSVVEGDFRLKITTTGGVGLGSNSQCNVTLWFTSTFLDGVIVKLSPV